ncbi:MAG: undecaprenyl-diphosphatase UppP [Patescibacteria group bacterium]
MSFLHAITLGLIQGITEFLPISSSGHLILAREFFGLPIAGSLSFDVFMHLATLLAIVIALWGDIKRLVKDFFTEGPSSRSKKVIWALIIGTLPAAIMGYFFGDMLEEIFRNPHYIAYALVAGSIIFFIADKIPKDISDGGGVTKLKGLFVGIFQTFALIPGVSRSGITISGGLLFGLSREEAIRFAFLLGIPTILGAGLKVLMDSSNILNFSDPTIWAGFVVAFLSGLLAIRFLIKFLSRHSFNLFIAYRLILAAVILFFL